jgi:hypothetical protein
LVGTGGGHIGSLVADSGAAVSTGTAGGLTATTDAASRAGTVSIVLREPAATVTATTTAATEATAKSTTKEAAPEEATPGETTEPKDTEAAPEETAEPKDTEAAPEETTEPKDTEAAPEETTEPETVEAVHVTKRQWAKVVKNPDAYEGKQYVIYGQVTQFDSATEADTFGADTAHTDTTDHGVFDGKATLLAGDEADLSDLVADDVFRATVTVIGSSDYETPTGRNTTVPHLKVNKLKVVGNNG